MKQMAYTMAVPVAVLAALSTACSDDDDRTDAMNPPGDSALAVTRTDIVADEPGAEVVDSMLVNAWGLAFNPEGVAWVSATETGVSAVYDANGKTMIPAVTIPSTEAEEPSAPTGQVHNGDSSSFKGDVFIFVTEGGTISGWQTTMGGEATQRVDNSASEAVYKGVTIVEGSSGPRLFAADFRGAKIDVFDATYAPVETNGFVDPEMPEGYAPFNVEELNGAVIVTYAEQDEEGEDDVKGPGRGYVSLFDVDGAMMARLISKGELDAPWGVALAPADFAAAPGSLLVGNFGDGLIHAYRFDMSNGGATATHQGELVDEAGAPLRIDGLWALKFGPDAGGFSSSTLYFTAGPEDETHGTFGRIESARASNQGGDNGSGDGSGDGTGNGGY